MFEHTIRPVTPEDLDGVTAVEAACASRPRRRQGGRALRWRIAQFPDRFFVACSAGRIIGLVNGCRSDRPQIDDTMFEAGAHVPDGPYQMIFGLAVLPELLRRRGVAAALLRQMIASSHTLGLASIALTCKAEKYLGLLRPLRLCGTGHLGVCTRWRGVVRYDPGKSLTTFSHADIIKARGAAALAAAGNRPA